MKRPQQYDAAVIENLAGRLFPRVKSWLEETKGEVFSGRSDQDLFDALTDLLHCTQNRWDGYDLARELEERSWAPDAELVAILHEAGSLAYLSLREEVVRWVAENDLVPTHVVGEDVTFRFYATDPGLSGRIDAVHRATMEYSVRMASGALLLVPEESVEHGGSQ